MKDLYDSDEEINSQDLVKKEVKAEEDANMSQEDSDEGSDKLKSDSSLEHSNAKKLKLRKLEKNEDLMLEEEVDDDNNMELDEILDLEEDPIGSQISEKKFEKEEEQEEEEDDFDEDKELQEMYGKNMAEDLCSDLDESDEENKRDP